MSGEGWSEDADDPVDDVPHGKRRRALGRIVEEDGPLFRSARLRSKPRPASRELGFENSNSET